jgi:tRNA(Arg) A34 adenosine deaminase TadA
VSIGCNRVVPENNSLLHGETVAIQVAQAKLQCYSLRNHGSGNFELFTSCEPCCMCLGATLWSGVSRIVCAASKSDASAIGFDEGPVYQQSYDHLEKAGIEVVRGVMGKSAAKVLQDYGKVGVIYNR